MLTIDEFQQQHPDRKTRCRYIGQLRITHRCDRCGHEFHPDACEFISYPPLRQQAVGVGRGLVAAAACIPVGIGVIYLASYVLEDLGHIGAALVLGIGGVGWAAMGDTAPTIVKDVLAKCPSCESHEITCMEPEKMGNTKPAT